MLTWNLSLAVRLYPTVMFYRIACVLLFVVSLAPLRSGRAPIGQLVHLSRCDEQMMTTWRERWQERAHRLKRDVVAIAFAVSNAGQVAKDLSKRGFQVRKDRRGISIADPDGIVIVFTSKYNKRA